MAARTAPEPPDEQAAGPDAESGSATGSTGAADASDGPGTPDGSTSSAIHGAEPGFFAWIRRTGLTRRTGWLGGVCAGIAHRTGLDPVLVRGIAVVLAVIGAPVVLLYALAWAFLPDELELIHAQELGRGRVTRALPGIIALFLLSFLPVTQGFWYLGALYWGDSGWGGALARAVWTGVILTVAIVVVVWFARRAAGDPVSTPATTDDRPETVPNLPADGTAADESAADPALSAALLPAAASASSPAAVLDPGAPPTMPTDASADELAAWKTQQELWKQQRAEWAAEQRRTERERRQVDAHARALDAASAARERARIRRLTRPRARAGVVFLVLGLGLVAAAIATLVASESRGTASAAWVIGAATLVAVLGLGTVVVAFCRRRSGALGFFSLLAVFALVVSVFVPTDRQLLLPGGGYGLTAPGRYAQLSGSTSLWVTDRSGAPRVVDLWQFSGDISITLDEGATVRIDATTDSDSLNIVLEEWFADDSRQYSFFDTRDGRASLTIGEGDPDVILKVWTRHAWVRVTSAFAPHSPLAVSPEPRGVSRSSMEGEELAPLGPGQDPLAPAPSSPATPTPSPVPTPLPTPAPTEGATP